MTKDTLLDTVENYLDRFGDLEHKFGVAIHWPNYFIRPSMVFLLAVIGTVLFFSGISINTIAIGIGSMLAGVSIIFTGFAIFGKRNQHYAFGVLFPTLCFVSVTVGYWMIYGVAYLLWLM